ncbi:hypothetical protein THICB1_150020 [Thiomonas arsenitoxydans]|uniref:Uncharacterized protein n=2 Tax=Thiomonas TaxID=32012 RepID=A0A238D3H6_THIDL|nr:hypothetical protein ACO7_120019 [Thiomonas arsenitoxydans]CQR30411.1 hypothetical protein THICB1_150020 [Thiomonas arsenitoxydans]SBP87801.1 hypothetical protein THIARS_60514 [Thiomonas delicata]
MQCTLLDAAPSAGGLGKVMAYGAVGVGVCDGALVDGEGAAGCPARASQ